MEPKNPEKSGKSDKEKIAKLTGDLNKYDDVGYSREQEADDSDDSGVDASKRTFDSVYQFKITLKRIRPPIWRRIQVPETYTFHDLHVAIQDVMGWEGYHLHEFMMADPVTGLEMHIGTPSEDFDFQEILHDQKEMIARYFTMEKQSAEYTYDFGDDWKHKVLLEKILPKDEDATYPVCIKRKRACPPDDCGGVGAMKNCWRLCMTLILRRTKN